PVSGAVGASVADDYVTLTVPILVDAELRRILLTPGSGAKLGALSEASFKSEHDAVDFNRNGAVDDLMFVILLQEGGQLKVWLDHTAGLDFRGVRGSGDWNATRDMIAVGAERIGFDIGSESLLSTAGEPTQVHYVSLV